MFKLEQITIGSTIVTESWMGGTVTGTVTGVDPDIKNGKPGVDYDDVRGVSRWTYLDQIVEVS